MVPGFSAVLAAVAWVQVHTLGAASAQESAAASESLADQARSARVAAEPRQRPARATSA